MFQLAVLSSMGSATVDEKTGTPRRLRRFFDEAEPVCEQPRQNFHSLSSRQVQQFFAAAHSHVTRAEQQELERDRIEATRFNVFDLIEPDENKLSDILADLLNPGGTHGQRAIFLVSLLRQLGVHAKVTAAGCAVVRREVATYGIAKFRRRIDVLIDAGVLIGIENKFGALEQTDQVKHYLEHLAYCGRTRRDSCTLIYLTPDGAAPESLNPIELAAAEAERRLHCWGYRRELTQWLEACRKQCTAPKIQSFLSDFLGYIGRTMPCDAETDLMRAT